MTSAAHSGGAENMVCVFITDPVKVWDRGAHRGDSWFVLKLELEETRDMTTGCLLVCAS